MLQSRALGLRCGDLFVGTCSEEADGMGACRALGGLTPTGMSPHRKGYKGGYSEVLSTKQVIKTRHYILGFGGGKWGLLWTLAAAAEGHAPPCLVVRKVRLEPHCPEHAG